MKQAFLVIVLVGVLATPAWAGCAWVLWVRAVGVGPLAGSTERKVEVTWDAQDAYEAKTECSKQAAVKNKEEEKKQKTLSQEAQKQNEQTTISVVLLHYRCLPDTVDPRAP